MQRWGWHGRSKDLCSVQISSVAQSCLNLCSPMDCSSQASLSITNSQSLSNSCPAGVQGFNLKSWTVSANETASQLFFWTGSLFQAYDSVLYFYKSIRPEVWYFQFPLTQIYYLYKSLLLFKQSSCFSDSLGISFAIYYLLPLMCPIVNVITL